MSEEQAEKAAPDAMALFVAAWAECQNPVLDCVNPRFGNRYASLRSTLAAVRAACRPHGIAYTQSLDRFEGGRELVSRVLVPGCGPMELSRFPVEWSPNPQAFGSAVTYAKRQQAQLDWGITGEEDDDAEGAGQDKEPPAGTPFAAHCRSCGARYTFASAEQMRGCRCCPAPDWVVEV